MNYENHDLHNYNSAFPNILINQNFLLIFLKNPSAKYYQDNKEGL